MSTTEPPTLPPISTHWKSVQTALRFSLAVSENDPNSLLEHKSTLKNVRNSEASDSTSITLLTVLPLRVGDFTARMALGTCESQANLVLSCAFDDPWAVFSAFQHHLPDIRSLLPNTEHRESHGDPEGIIGTTYAILGWAASKIPLYGSYETAPASANATPYSSQGAASNNHDETVTSASYVEMHKIFDLKQFHSSGLSAELVGHLKHGKALTICGHGVSGLLAHVIFYSILSRVLSVWDRSTTEKQDLTDLEARLLPLCGKFRCITFGAPICGPSLLVDLSRIHPAAPLWSAKGFVFQYANELDIVPRLSMLDAGTRLAILGQLQKSSVDQIGVFNNFQNTVSDLSSLISDASKQTALFLALIPRKIFPIGKPHGGFALVKPESKQIEEAKNAEEMYLSLALKPPRILKGNSNEGSSESSQNRTESNWKEYLIQGTKLAYMKTISSFLNSLDERQFKSAAEIYAPTVNGSKIRFIFVGNTLYVTIPGNNLLFVKLVQIDQDGIFTDFVTHTNNLIQFQCPSSVGTKTTPIRFTLTGQFGGVAVELNATKNIVDLFHRLTGARAFYEETPVGDLLHYGISLVVKSKTESPVKMLPSVFTKGETEIKIDDLICSVQSSLYQIYQAMLKFAHDRGHTLYGKGFQTAIDLVPIPLSTIMNQYIPLLSERPEKSLHDAAEDTINQTAYIFDSDIFLEFDVKSMSEEAPLVFNFLTAHSIETSETSEGSRSFRIQGTYTEKCAEIACAFGVDVFKLMFKEFYLESAIACKLQNLVTELKEPSALTSYEAFSRMFLSKYKALFEQSSPLYFVSEISQPTICATIWAIYCTSRIRLSVIQSFSVAVVGPKNSGKSTICKALWGIQDNMHPKIEKKPYTIYEFLNGYNVVDTNGDAILDTIVSSNDDFHPLAQHILLVIPLQETESRSSLEHIQDVLTEFYISKTPFSIIFSKCDFIESGFASREALEAEVAKRIESINRHITKFYEKSEKDQKIVQHAEQGLIIPPSERRLLNRVDCLISGLNPRINRSDTNLSLKEKGILSSVDLKTEMASRFAWANGILLTDADNFFNYAHKISFASVITQRYARAKLIRKKSQPVIEKRMKRILSLIKIRNSEQEYVINLRAVVEQYIQPLREQKILSEEEIQLMFPSIEILYGIHKQLLFDLNVHIHASSKSVGDFTVGNVILQKTQELSILEEYASKYYESLVKIEEWKAQKESFSQFLKVAKETFASVFPKLADPISLPLSRMGEYRVLLEDVLSKTDSSHADWPSLSESLKICTSIQESVDSIRKRAEVPQEIYDLLAKFSGLESSLIIKPGRKLLLQGKVISKVNGVEFGLVCFNDALVLISGTTEDGFKISHLISFRDSVFYDYEDNKYSGNVIIAQAENMFLPLCFQTKDEKLTVLTAHRAFSLVVLSTQNQ